jgi:hypothetical protein
VQPRKCVECELDFCVHKALICTVGMTCYTFGRCGFRIKVAGVAAGVAASRSEVVDGVNGLCRLPLAGAGASYR